MNKRVRCLFKGIVQGVGFRPFIFRTAVGCGLAGFVQNSRDGVVVEVEGAADDIEKFIGTVRADAPPLADIADFSCSDIPLTHAASFQIVESARHGGIDVHSAPDSATCRDCLAELFNPSDRRFRYPFINCTGCGPRLTIVRDIPYDRANTSMACFTLCARCREEYENPADRRFHAEPNACPVCGPKLVLYDAEGKPLAAADMLAEAVKQLRQGAVLAVKGLGGFHLCVDAASDAAVQRLRSRKCREKKPLAVMVKDIKKASAVAEIDAADQALLLSPQRPIVLVKKKKKGLLSEAVAPGMAHLGIMLPYTPLHHLLLADDFHALVMTSANRTDEPICTGNREAVARLNGIADFFLMHNRDILVRCDDSVAMTLSGSPCLLRRARGFVPRPLNLAESLPEVLALGPHLKATVCILKGDRAFLSPHIGDMATPQARDFFHESITLMKKITECSPGIIACDLHPGYYSTRIAESFGDKPVIKAQHHHAHIVSCMAENRISGEVIGLAMDGTGYGTDGSIWGGEFLIADTAEFRRIGHIKYFMLPGGEQAIHEPWRCATSLLREACGEAWQEMAGRLGLAPEKSFYPLIEKSMRQGINTPYTSSLGRLFDAVAALLGLRGRVSFEGQAAMELEAAAAQKTHLLMPYNILEENGMLLLDFIPALRALVEKRLALYPREELAAGFHGTLCHAFTEMAGKIREQTGLGRIVLSGGCFQNRKLLEGCVAAMGQAGFEVFTHHLVPTNDGGIALGQAVIAGTRMKKNSSQ